MEYEDADLYNTLRTEEQLAKTRILRRELGDHKTLDVGCGTGISSSLFSDVVGIDPKQTLLDANPYPHVRASAEEIPFGDNEFEVVIAVTSIHNFSDIKKGLDEMKRVGKRFGFSLLNASKRTKECISMIQERFIVDKIIDEQTDTIIICHKE